MSKSGHAGSGGSHGEQGGADRAAEPEQAAPHSVAAGTLYVVATPIGNLQDVTLRALTVLGAVDVVAAEDTRNTARLLDRHHIRAQLLSLHEHNEAARSGEVARLLGEGKSVAYVTDAGTPALSDPGALLVERVRAAGFPAVPIPGPSAAVAALSVAGDLARGGFRFAGFLPERPAARRRAIAALAAQDCTLVFYEAPHRVVETVEDLAAGLGAERDVVVARELTKLFESVQRLRLGDAAAWLRTDPNRQRGEFVLLVSGAPAAKEEAGFEPVLVPLLAELPLAQAVKLACAITGAKRGEVYARALELKKD